GDCDVWQAPEHVTDISPTPSILRVRVGAERCMEVIQVCPIHLLRIVLDKKLHVFRYVFRNTPHVVFRLPCVDHPPTPSYPLTPIRDDGPPWLHICGFYAA